MRSSPSTTLEVVLTDVFSKYTMAVPTRDQWAATVARVLVSGWFYKFGVPTRLHSDQGHNCENILIQQLCKLYGVVKLRTTLYHPEGNGQSERFNWTLLNLLRTLPVSRKRDWHVCLPHVFYCYNMSPQQSTGESRCFGRSPGYSLISFWARLRILSAGQTTSGFRRARKRLKHAADRRKRAHDQHVQGPPLQERQLVYLRDFSARGHL